MIYAVVFLIAVIVLLVILLPRKGMFKKNFVGNNMKFIEWAKEIHGGEEHTVTILNEKATSVSESVEIKYNFSTGKGELFDKAIGKRYKVIFDDGKFYTLEK
jgi:hypothetical protein